MGEMDSSYISYYAASENQYTQHTKKKGSSKIVRYRRAQWFSLFAFLGYSVQSHATFPDVYSMLQAYAGQAIYTPELNDLIVALNRLDAFPVQQQDALFSLTPLADGALRATSEGTMRQLVSTLFERVEKIVYVEDAIVIDVATLAGQGDKHEDAHMLSKAQPEVGLTSETTALAAKKSTTVSPGERVDFQKGFWGMLLGNVARQDRDQVPGYKAEVAGGVLGREGVLYSCLRIGLAGGYQHANVVSKGPSGSFFGAERYQGTAYFAADAKVQPYFLHGAFTVAKNVYDNNRKILVEPILGAVNGKVFSQIAKAKFSGLEWNGYVEGGYLYDAFPIQAKPLVLVNYTHFHFDSYDESDVFGLGLKVKYDAINTLTAGVGGKLQYKNTFEKAVIMPELHAYYFYDVLNDSQQATASFLGGGYAFLSQGPKPAKGSYEVGVAMVIHSYHQCAFHFQYDYAARENYFRHQALIKLRYEWV